MGQSLLGACRSAIRSVPHGGSGFSHPRGTRAGATPATTTDQAGHDEHTDQREIEQRQHSEPRGQNQQQDSDQQGRAEILE